MKQKASRSPKVRGRVSIHDWALLLAQFQAEWEPHGRTLKEFCANREVPLPYPLAKAAFSREKMRTALVAIHARNKPRGLIAQRRVMEALAKISADGAPVSLKAGEFALKVFTAVMEREEPNATLAQQINIVIPPLFPESDAAKRAMKSLMEGT